jgi:hypothetical protein
MPQLRRNSRRGREAVPRGEEGFDIAEPRVDAEPSVNVRSSHKENPEILRLPEIGPRASTVFWEL